MRVKILGFCLTLLLVLPLCGKFEPLIDLEQQQRYADFTELYLIYMSTFYHGFDKDGKVNMFSIVDKPEMLLKVERFEKFIARRPNSHLVDEAKILTAETYHNLNELRPFFGEVNINKQWEGKANQWLLDILNNHTQDKYLSFSLTTETEEYSVAIALWYLGSWNSNPHFLKRLIEEYPTSKFAGSASEFLRRRGMLNWLFR